MPTQTVELTSFTVYVSELPCAPYVSGKRASPANLKSTIHT